MGSLSDGSQPAHATDAGDHARPSISPRGSDTSRWGREHLQHVGPHAPACLRLFTWLPSRMETASATAVPDFGRRGPPVPANRRWRKLLPRRARRRGSGRNQQTGAGPTRDNAPARAQCRPSSGRESRSRQGSPEAHSCAHASSGSSSASIFRTCDGSRFQGTMSVATSGPPWRWSALRIRRSRCVCSSTSHQRASTR